MNKNKPRKESILFANDDDLFGGLKRRGSIKKDGPPILHTNIRAKGKSPTSYQ